MPHPKPLPRTREEDGEGVDWREGTHRFPPHGSDLHHLQLDPPPPHLDPPPPPRSAGTAPDMYYLCLDLPPLPQFPPTPPWSTLDPLDVCSGGRGGAWARRLLRHRGKRGERWRHLGEGYGDEACGRKRSANEVSVCGRRWASACRWRSASDGAG